MARGFSLLLGALLMGACTGSSGSDALPALGPPATEEPPAQEEPPGEIPRSDGEITLARSGEVFDSLAAAVAAAEPGDVLELGPGIYREQVLIDKDLTLRGRDGFVETVLEGERRFRPVEVVGATVLLEDLTFLHGSSDPGGAVRAQDAQLTVRRCTFAECRSGDRAGAVSIRASAATSVVFDDCVFRDCTSLGRGGAVYAAAGSPGESVSLLFLRCRFLRNDGNAGGAILLSAGFGDASVEAQFDRCTFEGNAGRDGGALMAESATGDASVSFECRSCLFADNESTGKGSAIRLVSLTGSAAVTARILHCTLAANRGPTRAGGFGAISGESPSMGASRLLLQNSVVFGNSPAGIFTSGIQFDSESSFVDRDPVFAGPTDFRLGFNSPAVDAGDPALLPPDMLLDLDGKPRTLGDAPDAGAYERE